MGKPIVASNIEGYASVITDGADGLLVPPKDSLGLAQALIQLLQNPSLRQKMGAKGLAKAQNYSWERVARDVLNYYMRLLSEPPWRRKFTRKDAAPLSV